MDRGINVFGAFDGMSNGQIALEKQGIKVNKYYASEIEKEPIVITQKNYPNTIQLGSITEIENIDWPARKIDLFIGGSPCQNFSFAGSAQGLRQDNIEITNLEKYNKLKQENFVFEGQSYLFWEYVRLLKEVQKVNPQVKFLLENVKMAKKWENVITEALGVKPKEINSKHFCAQNRPRLYWTNIQIDSLPNNGDVIKDILEKDADFNFNYAGWMLNKWGEKRRLDQFFNVDNKASCLTANMAKGQKPSYCVNDEKAIHKFTVNECERLQTVPFDYTKGVSNGARYKMLGNGWTVDVIAHIFKNLKQ